MSRFQLGDVVRGYDNYFRGEQDTVGIITSIEKTRQGYYYKYATQNGDGDIAESHEDNLERVAMSLGATLAMIGKFHNGWVARYAIIVEILLRKAAERRDGQGHALPTEQVRFPPNMAMEDRQRYMQQGQVPKFMSMDERKKFDDSYSRRNESQYSMERQNGNSNLQRYL